MQVQEYEVEVVFDVASEMELDPTRVETMSAIAERIVTPPPPPVPLTRRERDTMARLKWILDDLGLGCFAVEIMRRLEGSR